MTLEEELIRGSTDIKGACCNFYEHDIVKIFLGDSLHPGGLSITEELGFKLNLKPNDNVLDLASGLGASAIYLGEKFGSNITGIDLSEINVTDANNAASEKNLKNVKFIVGDAENLNFDSEEFDVVISECSFCLFPEKKSVAKEIFRILKQEGRLGITDVVIEKKLPILVETLLFQVACIGVALPMEGYRRIFEEVGFKIDMISDRKDSIFTMLNTIRKKIFVAEIAQGLKKINLDQLDLDKAKHWLKEGERLVTEGYGTYMMLIGRKD